MIRRSETRLNVKQEVILMVALRQSVARLTELADQADSRNDRDAASKWRADARAAQEVHDIVSHAEFISTHRLINGE